MSDDGSPHSFIGDPLHDGLGLDVAQLFEGYFLMAVEGMSEGYNAQGTILHLPLHPYHPGLFSRRTVSWYVVSSVTTNPLQRPRLPCHRSPRSQDNVYGEQRVRPDHLYALAGLVFPLSPRPLVVGLPSLPRNLVRRLGPRQSNDLKLRSRRNHL